MSALWREYAKADARWAGADLTVISLELLTVGLGAPLAAYVCYLCVRRDRRFWVWAGGLAVGELYGGECLAASVPFLCLPLEGSVCDFDDRRFELMRSVYRLHDICAGMAVGEYEFGWIEFHVHVGVLGLL